MDLCCRAPRAADSSEVDTVGMAGEIAEDYVEKLRWEAIRPWTARFTSAGHGGIWGQLRSASLICCSLNSGARSRFPVTFGS
jgi:hypothetical protein